MNADTKARVARIAALQSRLPDTWTVGSDIEGGRILYFAVEITPTHRTSHEAWSLEELTRLIGLGVPVAPPPTVVTLASSWGAAAPTVDGTVVRAVTPPPPAAAKRAPQLPGLTPREEARIRGFEGEPCPVEGTFTMVRNGTCLKCINCGETTGCS